MDWWRMVGLEIIGFGGIYIVYYVYDLYRYKFKR